MDLAVAAEVRLHDSPRRPGGVLKKLRRSRRWQRWLPAEGFRPSGYRPRYVFTSPTYC